MLNGAWLSITAVALYVALKVSYMSMRIASTLLAVYLKITGRPPWDRPLPEGSMIVANIQSHTLLTTDDNIIGPAKGRHSLLFSSPTMMQIRPSSYPLASGGITIDSAQTTVQLRRADYGALLDVGWAAHGTIGDVVTIIESIEGDIYAIN